MTEQRGDRSRSADGCADGRFLVVLPTYDERENLPRIVPKILEQDPRFDVLIVDDNSPDGTGEVADQLARQDPHVHVLHREGKHGLGRAYIDGFRWALDRHYPLILQMDADFSHDPGHLPQFLVAARHHDIVVGSRYVSGRVRVVNWPVARLLLSYFGTIYARVITGLPVTDATSGFKCWHRYALESLHLDAIESNGYAFQIEMSFRAWKRGYTIGEIPIVFVERDTGESKMSKKIVREAVWKVWKLRFLDLVGRLR
ncbi:MAG: polyprenol monophosphomannose synthase [Gemmatimonadetes bacterium]|nr:polyprenol monophosphomannose synthase [Gemmatimonadota bacterium]